MKSPADMILAELGAIRQIVKVACTVESAKRGEPVRADDPGVQTLVADMILGGLGEELRSVLDGELEQRSQSAA
jgi:hypothetical protein